MKLTETKTTKKIKRRAAPQKAAAGPISAAVAGRGKPRPAAAKVAAEGKSVSQGAGGFGGGVTHFYISSQARSHWSEVKNKALNGEPVAILVGSRVLLVKEVALSYAELEYGVTKAQLNAKADEIETRGCEEIDNGEATEVT